MLTLDDASNRIGDDGPSSNIQKPGLTVSTRVRCKRVFIKNQLVLVNEKKLE